MLSQNQINKNEGNGKSIEQLPFSRQLWGLAVRGASPGLKEEDSGGNMHYP